MFVEVCGVILLCGIVQTPAAEVQNPDLRTLEFELGPGGLIANGFALGYLPGRANEDRLAAIGGEANMAPYGGQAMVLSGALSTAAS